MNDNSAIPARPRTGWRPGLLFWIVTAIVLFILSVAAIAGGFAAVLVFLGIIAVLTGLYALLLKRRTWVGIPHRKSALAVTLSGVLVFMLGGIAAAGAAPSTDGSQAALVAAQETTPAASATPTETNPAETTCLTVDESQTYNGETFICTQGDDAQLVWLSEAQSRKVVEAREAKAKVLAAKIAADKVAAQKAAAKAAADKLAAEKAAAKAAADKLAAEKAAAQEAAARKAAEKSAADQAAAAQAAADQAAAQAAAEQAAQQVVVPAAPAPASVYYKNCTAARAAGAAPVYAGSPGYAAHLDRDGDGIGCE
ncbi:excalibur calcium-binding domain-containing protein [Arthrobacter globiformis]|nr:excalibur calcium-binding domain-containing protein [Arthrobacter globiformis]